MKESRNCIYCGKTADTVDHVPPKCFLDKPYPNNLLTLPACKKCNNNCSSDEQYLMYLSDYIRSIENVDGEFTREKAKLTFEHSEKLEDRMISSLKIEDGVVYFDFETDRVIKIIDKVSYGLLYAHYGTSFKVTKSNFAIITSLNEKQCSEFDSIKWIIVQEKRFKYSIASQLIYFVVNDIILCVSSYSIP